MPHVRSNGIELFYDVRGDGPPLLLLAGLGYGAFYWRHVVPLLETAFRVVTVDNRGSDRSDKPMGPYSTRVMAQDAAAALDALQLGGAAVIGHSLGGFIAQELALARPELVRALVLCSTTHGGPTAVPITPSALAVMMNRALPAEELFQRGLSVSTARGWAEKHPALVDELREYRRGQPVPAGAYLAQMTAGAMHDAAMRLGALRMPTLVVTGDEDQVVPPANAPLLAAKIRGARVETLAGCGHLLGWEGPGPLVTAIVRFLER